MPSFVSSFSLSLSIVIIISFESDSLSICSNLFVRFLSAKLVKMDLPWLTGLLFSVERFFCAFELDEHSPNLCKYESELLHFFCSLSLFTSLQTRQPRFFSVPAPAVDSPTQRSSSAFVSSLLVRLLIAFQHTRLSADSKRVHFLRLPSLSLSLSRSTIPLQFTSGLCAPLPRLCYLNTSSFDRLWPRPLLLFDWSTSALSHVHLTFSLSLSLFCLF
jgi:hypothetical protein